ncbi:hypothetical protein [Rheinheimera salexigens]|uniref:Uncharacterized protein n=1 Tax=Rheinheimera salexigens TaxID=1628148 RepID=A0A1E7Q8I4_9GAMM|nr:hypothetical protein [Rheinheimera salexigens]OEY70348.1 hypothetical protein BI198_12775 [Rheinheimera salexigens]
MNIRELRAELKQWGRFWANKELLQGYASTSVTARCCEMLQTGIWISSDKHLFSHQADEIFVPHYIEQLDKKMHTLPLQQKAVITKRYIKQKKLSLTERLALLHAETILFQEYS